MFWPKFCNLKVCCQSHCSFEGNLSFLSGGFKIFLFLLGVLQFDYNVSEYIFNCIYFVQRLFLNLSSVLENPQPLCTRIFPFSHSLFHLYFSLILGNVLKSIIPPLSDSQDSNLAGDCVHWPPLMVDHLFLGVSHIFLNWALKNFLVCVEGAALQGDFIFSFSESLSIVFLVMQVV